MKMCRMPRSRSALAKRRDLSRQAGVLDLLGTSDDPDRGCLPTGQSCGGVHDIKPAGSIVQDFLAEARAALARLPGR